MENHDSKFCLPLLLYLFLTLYRQSNEESLEAIRMLLKAAENEKRKKQICSFRSIPTKPMQIVPHQQNYSGSVRVHVLVNELYPNFHGETLGATSLLFYDNQYAHSMDMYDDVYKAKSFAQGFNAVEDDLELILAANDIELSQLFDHRNNESSVLNDGGNVATTCNLSDSSMLQYSAADVNMPDESSQDSLHNAVPAGELDDVPFSSLSLEDLPASVDSGVHDEIDTLDGCNNDSDVHPEGSPDVIDFPSLPESNAEQEQDAAVAFDPNESFLTGEEVDDLLATMDDAQVEDFEIEQTSDYDAKDVDHSNEITAEADSNSSEFSQNNFLPISRLDTPADMRKHFSTRRDRAAMRNSHSSRYTSFTSDSGGSSAVDLGEYDEASRSSAHSVSSSDFSTQHGSDYQSASFAPSTSQFASSSLAPSTSSQFEPLQSNGAAAMPVDLDFHNQNQHKDVQLLEEANVPFSYEEVAYSSNEEFRRMRATPGLTDEQCSAMLDARRRATNRKAAERCRQQKNIERNGLSHDLKSLMERKREMERQVAKARHRRDRARDNLSVQRQELFSRLRDSSNRPLHPNQWKLQLTEQGELMLIRRELVSES